MYGYVLGRAVLGAGLTAFYMTRLMIMTFFGRPRWEEGVHPHEAPAVMTVPMIVLAVGSVVAGSCWSRRSRCRTGWPRCSGAQGGEHVIAPLTFGIVITLVAVLGVALAWLFVGRREVPVAAPVRVSPVTRAARNALYADTINESLFMRPGQWLTRALVFVDNRGVDGAVNGLAADARRLVGAARPDPDRLRPHLRPRHARRRVLVAGALLAVTAG